MPDKRTEKSLAEAARRLYPLFPSGELEDCEGPDFLISEDQTVIGIEVTQLYQLTGASPFSRRQVESFHKKIICHAQTLYDTGYVIPADVGVYFSSSEGVYQDAKSMATTLAKFVRAHQPTAGLTTHFLSGFRTVAPPPGFASITVSPAFFKSAPRWWSGEIGETVALTREMLGSVIAGKNVLIPKYKKKAKRVWLLIVADLFPLSGSFSVPRDIGTWKFSSDFEKVLLFSREDTTVFELV